MRQTDDNYFFLIAEEKKAENAFKVALKKVNEAMKEYEETIDKKYEIKAKLKEYEH